ncbi:MAG: hypothetical protein LBQ90_11360 [Synergistaceae bacterium]|jgi:uncharacterized Zn finger protein|nr:hypothetical protein [Synergistaceae bacterium]
MKNIGTTRTGASSKSGAGSGFQSKSKKELIELLTELRERFSEVDQFLFERAELDSGSVEALVESLRGEIVSVTAEPAWSHSWDDRCELPDYSHLQEQFQALAEKGYVDELLDLGEELWRRGNAQLGEANDEGETGSAISDCMEIVMKAIPQSSLSGPEQLFWGIERLAWDNYGVMGEEHSSFTKSGNYTEADWQGLARLLESHLLTMQENAWPRGTFADWLRQAYELGGLQEQVIPLLEREENYVQLVKALLEAGRREEARQKCILGYGKKFQSYSARALHDCLREMAMEEEKYDLAAAYRADIFFDEPNVKTYTALRDIAEKAACWPAVREGALHFLETGERPEISDVKSKKDQKTAWPLPPTEVAHLRNTPERDTRGRFPKWEVLVRIAILEKRLDDVIELYRAMPKGGVQIGWSRWGRYDLDNDVALAVSHSHPDVALSIWRTIVDSLIAEVKAASYQQARPYLERMSATYECNGRSGEWKKLIADLRTTHKAKRRLLEVLSAVE